MGRETIEIELTPEERSLLLKYGYPFEPIKLPLKAFEESQRIEIVPMDSFYLGQLIGDLCHSINHMEGGSLQDQLFELCDRLEAAEKYGEGMLDIF
jgi:hypothetical protein